MEACEIVRTLMASTGDDFEVINYSRLSTLKYANSISVLLSTASVFSTISLGCISDPLHPKPSPPVCLSHSLSFLRYSVSDISLRGDYSKIQAGDCVVAFSRADIFSIRK